MIPFSHQRRNRLLTAYMRSTVKDYQLLCAPIDVIRDTERARSRLARKSDQLDRALVRFNLAFPR